MRLSHKGAMIMRLVSGTIGAVIGAIIGAIAWAAISSATGFQIGYVAVGVGFLAGYGMRTLGGGRDRADGIIAGIVALFGCMLGNLLAAASVLAAHIHRSVPDVSVRLLLRPAIAFEVLKATFQVMDVLFYAIAIYAAYRAAMKPAQIPVRTVATTPTASPAAAAPPPATALPDSPTVATPSDPRPAYRALRRRLMRSLRSRG